MEELHELDVVRTVVAEHERLQRTIAGFPVVRPAPEQSGEVVQVVLHDRGPDLVQRGAGGVRAGTAAEAVLLELVGGEDVSQRPLEVSVTDCER